MKYAGILKDDFVNGQNVCVSFWVQGCPFRCKGCHNPQTWDFDGGIEADEDTISTVLKTISKNGIQRNLSILGGEPLCKENRSLVAKLIAEAKAEYSTIKIFVWTGYELDELFAEKDKDIETILTNSDMLITGRFILAERDITLPLRGSRNQKILRKGVDY